MQMKERLAQEQRDAALVNRLVPPTTPPERDSEPLMPEVIPQRDTLDGDPDDIFRSAVSEIETQPLPPQPQEVSWPVVMVILLFLLSFVGGTVMALITYPTVTIEVVPVTKSISLTTPLVLSTRALAPVTLTTSLTGPTTGKGHQDARAASGTLTFYNGLFTATANHPVGVEASTLTVHATGTCTGIAYNSEQLSRQATALFTKQTTPGANYQLVGEVQVQLVSAAPLTVSCRGMWAYTMSQDYEQFLAERIAGDNPQQARKYLLHTGFLTHATVPDKLPQDPAHIHFQVFIGL